MFGSVYAQLDLELTIGFGFVCAQTAVELAMRFWSEITPLGLAIRVRWCPQRQAGKRRKERRPEGVTPFIKT